MKKFFAEFKEFAMRGNVFDMAVGVVIGGAFKTIIDSLIKDVISPILGIAGNVDFSDFMFTVGGATIRYGAFLTAVLNFVLMAFVVFLMVKGINKLRSLGVKEAPPVAPSTKNCPYCKNSIPVDATRCGYCTSVLETIGD